MGHLKNLKIAVMGCIVNGPGEMADADYGYVGAGPGKVTLYRGKNIIRKNVDEKEALDALEELIRLNGDWRESEDI
jgi:(E)-4-hydroxy-3-methylbut-2-enyl-diphosphate synthase